MKLLSLACLSGVALAAIQNPCDVSNYIDDDTIVQGNGAGGYTARDPDGPLDPNNGEGHLDPWKITWDAQMKQEMAVKACHSCAECLEENLCDQCVIPDDLPPTYADPCHYPNGFRSGQIAMDNEPPFCITVPSSLAGNANIQVLIEADNSFDRICIQSQGSEIALNNGVTKEAQCAEGQLNACFPAENAGENMNLMVFCDTGCPEADISFKYKVLNSRKRSDSLGQDSAIDNVDMWCMFQDGKQEVAWPSEMKMQYPNGIRGPKRGPAVGAAPTVAPTVLAAVATVFAAVALRR